MKLDKINLKNFSGSWTDYYIEVDLDEYVTKSEETFYKNLDLRQKIIFDLLKRLEPELF